MVRIIGDWVYLAKDTYNVNPVIFISLIILSIPFYYWSLFSLGKIIFKKSKEKLLYPLLVNLTAWIAPYVYILIFGRNLPIWFWIVFIGWIVVSAFFMINKIFKAYKNG